MNMASGREALRQRLLLRALLGDAGPDALQGWVQGDAARSRRGLQAYRAHAGALAERALGVAYPTVAALLGEESFGQLARAHWQRQPPDDGDIGHWGDTLPEALSIDPQLQDDPYLADVARLDWAVHRAGFAADGSAPPQGLAQLADGDPDRLWLALQPGHAVLSSPHPVQAIWLAHRSDAPGRFDPVRRAFDQGRSDAVRVRREGWRVAVDLITPPEAGFEQAVLSGHTLAEALDAAGPSFDFGAWLAWALQAGALAGVHPSRRA